MRTLMAKAVTVCRSDPITLALPITVKDGYPSGDCMSLLCNLADLVNREPKQRVATIRREAETDLRSCRRAASVCLREARRSATGQRIEPVE